MNPSLINGFSNAFSDASFSWFEALYPIAQRLFLLLATIELTWSGIWWALAARQDSVLVPLLRKVVSLMFFYTVLLLAPQWIPMVIRSFITAGQTASGFQGLAPASVFAQGIDVAVGMFTKIGSLMALLGAAAWLIVAPFVVVICFALISAMMTLTLVESYFVIGGGVLLLGFAGSRWTATFAEGYLIYAVRVGLRLFVLYLLIGVGTTLPETWLAELNSGTNTVRVLFEVMGGSIIFALLIWRVPHFVGSMLGDRVTLHMDRAYSEPGG